MHPLAVLEPGTFSVETAILTGDPRSARTEALTDSELLEVDADTLWAVLDQHPKAARSIRVMTLIGRLRSTDELVGRLLKEDPLIQVLTTLDAAAARPGKIPARIGDVIRWSPKTAPTRRCCCAGR